MEGARATHGRVSASAISATWFKCRCARPTLRRRWPPIIGPSSASRRPPRPAPRPRSGVATQPMLARIVAKGDTFYRGHEGGFPAEDIVAVAEVIDRLPSARFAGVTSFPTQLFDSASGAVKPTPNLATLSRAAEALAKAGRSKIELNAPGTTSTEILPMLAEAGATQIEPGHGLTGTTPLHVVKDLPEIPAVDLSQRGLASHRLRSVLLWRRPLHRPRFSGLSGPGDCFARALDGGEQACAGRNPRPSVDRLLWHDRRDRARKASASATASSSGFARKLS